MNKSKAQGSIEYLLMIGAAVLIVAVVIIAIVGLISESKDENSTSDYDGQMDKLNNLLPNQTSSQVNLPSITSFSVEGIEGSISRTSITLTLPSGSPIDLSSITPNFSSTSGSSVSPSGARNFSSGPVTYIVTASDGNTRTYTVTITKNVDSPVNLLSDKNILVIFNDFYESNFSNLTYNESTNTYNVFFYYGAPKKFSPFFIISNGASIKKVGRDVNSNYCDYNSYYIGGYGNCYENNSEIVDFSNPVEYIVTAKDGSTHTYNIKVTVLLDSSKSILFFEFYPPSAVGIINEVNKTVSVKVPFETNVTSLTPNIVISKTASINNLGVTKDFSNPLVYTVTAMDGSTQNYTVSVVKESISYNLISTCQELQNMNNNLAGNYKLANNIDCNNFNFTPIGGGWNELTNSCNSVLSGSFDGNGKLISNLTISGDVGVGLFGCSIGNISNVGLVNVRVSGKWWVGGLVGHQIGGIINNSFSTGRVVAEVYQGGAAGGLVGAQTGDSYISNCYSTADVSIWLWDAGGLVGSGARINNSYSIGRVSGGVGSFVLGGLTPSNYFSELLTSYWDVNTSNQFSSGTGTGKTTAEMKTPSTFVGWNNGIWKFVQGEYPKLWFENSTSLVSVWSGELYGSYQNAVNYCSTWGGRLPTKEEVCEMISLSSWPPFLDSYCYYYYWTSSTQGVERITVSDNCSTSCVTQLSSVEGISNKYKCIK